MNWFFHDPGQGRQGPVPAAQLREFYRKRRIQRDTLVWRGGMREWQPLERMAEELDLAGVVPDPSRPPPLPPGAIGPAASTGRASAHAGRASPAPRSSGCLIAAVIALVVSVPLVSILAAVALPAYQDYTIRAKTRQFMQPREEVLRPGTERAQSALRRCPRDLDEAGVPENLSGGTSVGTTDDGRCAFQLTVTAVHPKVDGRSIVHVAPASPGDAWDCTGGDLPPRYRAAACRASATETDP